jgi:hypothetical protein
MVEGTEGRFFSVAGLFVHDSGFGTEGLVCFKDNGKIIHEEQFRQLYGWNLHLVFLT